MVLIYKDGDDDHGDDDGGNDDGGDGGDVDDH